MAHAQQQQLEYEAAKAEMAAQASPPAAASAVTDSDLFAELNTLAALHQSGALSDAEFAAAKAKLIG